MYTYITQFDSPNYTPGSQTRSVWGRDRKIEAIAIHWWGDPNQNPSFEGIVNYLCRSNGNSSAHFVATGTGRRVACLVAPIDNAWATNNANPTTIAIECDPRCRPEDYDVVGELVAELRATYGNLPLVPHNQYAQTACPGNYDLNRINQVAATKFARAEDEFGLAHNKADIPPVKVEATREQIKALYLEILERPADEDGLNHYSKHTVEYVRADLLASTERSLLLNRKAAEEAAKAESLRAQKEAEELAKKVAAEQEAKRIADEKAAQEAAKKAAEEAAKQGGYNQADRDRDNLIASIVKSIWEFLKGIFRTS